MNEIYTDYRHTPQFIPWESERFMNLKLAAGYVFDTVPLAPVCKFNVIKDSALMLRIRKIKSELPMANGQLDKDRFDLVIDNLYTHVDDKLYCAQEVRIKQTTQKVNGDVEYRVGRSVVFFPYDSSEGGHKEVYVNLLIVVSLNGDMSVDYKVEFLANAIAAGINLSYTLNEIEQ